MTFRWVRHTDDLPLREAAAEVLLSASLALLVAASAEDGATSVAAATEQLAAAMLEAGVPESAQAQLRQSSEDLAQLAEVMEGMDESGAAMQRFLEELEG